MFVLTKVMVGKRSTSKKSALRRCSSRWSLRVSTLADWIVTVAREFDRSSRSASNSPSSSLKEPRTVVTIACRAENPRREWPGSIFHDPERSISVSDM